ncbi:26869_t:CDS:1, partial [Racocetra persica]
RKIPVLIDEDFTINESRAICNYLTSKYQGKHNATILIPTDVHKARLVLQCISYELFYYNPPIFKLIQQEIAAKKFYNKDPDQVIKQAREELAKVLDVYEKILEEK